MQARVAIRPDRRVVQPVKTGVSVGAAVDMDAQRLGRREAEVVITVGRLRANFLLVALRAGDRVARGIDAEWRRRNAFHPGAGFEMPDLVGESDVVRVRGPDHTRVL